MSDQVLEQLKHIVENDLDLNLSNVTLDETTPLFEGGLSLDSVILVELISFIEKRFNIELSDDLLNMDTFRDLRSISRVVREQLAAQRVEERAQA